MKLSISSVVIGLGVCCVWMSTVRAQPLQYTPSFTTQIHSGSASASVVPSVQVEVFATSTTNLQNTAHAVVYVLDTLVQLENRLSQGLPSDPEAAMAMVQKRLAQLSAVDNSRMNLAIEGRLKAQRYGIKQLPAMVLNGSAVVYGVSDVRDALERHAQGQAEAVRGGERNQP